MPSKTVARDERQSLIHLLNQQLADSLDLGLQFKQAHWNVKGPNFLALHELFDQSAALVADFTDELAERIVAIGGSAKGTLQTVARSSRLKPYPTDLRAGSSHLATLSAALIGYGRSMRETLRCCERANDAGSADLCTAISRKIDELVWKTSAQLQAGG
jgi:starvation-inducible DNA-binding protein